MKRIDIPKQFIPRLKELQEEDSAYEIYSYLKKINAIQLFTTLGIDIYLTFDGQVLVAKYEEEEIEPRDAKNFAEVAMAIILGSERRGFPELLTLLPERSEGDVNCEFCENNSGWNKFPGVGKFICGNCGGLGWIPKEDKSFMNNKKVIIIGAGLAGSLLSLYLAKRGIETEIYESRGDMRLEEMAAGRSINLALSDRGIAALKEVGMDEYMLDEAVPMYGRLIHSLDGTTNLLPYSGREGEYINSVSRGGLNIALINEADNYSESRFHFDQRCVGFDCETGEALMENAETGEKYSVKGETVIATDGAGSAVRKAMFSSKCVPRFNFQQSFLEHGYKELSILPKSEFVGELPKLSDKATGEFLMANDALHIWARHQFMMIALPNFDGSFTCTLFLAFKGGNATVKERVDSEENTLPNGRVSATEFGSDDLKDEESLMKFFETNFADAIPLMPHLKEEFFANPTGNLGTIKCFPWNVGGKSLLLGDSAHALVPFYGQGMNCAFEDCRILNDLIEKYGTNWEKVFTEYGNERKINTDAIADLALENFHEMQDAVADPVFVKKRELETRLEHTFPDYFSKYSLVTFREDIPYSEAKKRGNAQNEILMKICENVQNVSEIDLNEVMESVKSIRF